MPLASETAASSTVDQHPARPGGTGEQLVALRLSRPLAPPSGPRAAGERCCRRARAAGALGDRRLARRDLARQPVEQPASPRRPADRTVPRPAQLGAEPAPSPPAAAHRALSCAELARPAAGCPAASRRGSRDHRLPRRHLAGLGRQDRRFRGQRRGCCRRAARRRCAACGRPARRRRRPARPRPSRWRPKPCPTASSAVPTRTWSRLPASVLGAVVELARHPRRAAGCRRPATRRCEAAFLFDLAIWLKPS